MLFANFPSPYNEANTSAVVDTGGTHRSCECVGVAEVDQTQPRAAHAFLACTVDIHSSPAGNLSTPQPFGEKFAQCSSGLHCLGCFHVPQTLKSGTSASHVSGPFLVSSISDHSQFFPSPPPGQQGNQRLPKSHPNYEMLGCGAIKGVTIFAFEGIVGDVFCITAYAWFRLGALRINKRSHGVCALRE